MELTNQTLKDSTYKIMIHQNLVNIPADVNIPKLMSNKCKHIQHHQEIEENNYTFMMKQCLIKVLKKMKT